MNGLLPNGEVSVGLSEHRNISKAFSPPLRGCCKTQGTNGSRSDPEFIEKRVGEFDEQRDRGEL